MFSWTVLSIFALNVLTPGASFVLTVRNAVVHGRRTGALLAAGLAAADALYACLALAGLAAVLKANSMLASAIGLLAGMWLFHLGVNLFLRRGADLQEQADRKAGELPVWQAFRLGLTTGLSNAQAIVFFSTVFVGGIAAGREHSPSAWLVCQILVESLVIRAGISQLFTMPAVRQAYMARKSVMETVSAFALMGFGAKVAFKALLVPLASMLAR